MNLIQTAVKPWKRTSTGPFGSSVLLWALVAVAVLVLTFFVLPLAGALSDTGYLPEIVVGALVWVLIYVPQVLFAVSAASIAVAAFRDIRHWHREHGSRKANGGGQ